MKGPDMSRLVLVLLCVLGMPNVVAACSCGRQTGPPCEEVWRSDVVFDGSVRSVTDVSHDANGRPMLSLRVMVEVHRGFLNAAAGPLELITPARGVACGFGFVEGRRYLVYASKSPAGTLSVTHCSRTRPIEKAGDDLRYLTALPASGTGGRVFGRITQRHRDNYEADVIDYGPLEGVPVNVRGPGFSVDTTTDVHGRFQISGLPVSQATLSVAAPPGFDSRYLERVLEITDPRACNQRDLQLSYIAAASGLVVDRAGRPVAGIRVDAVAAELAGHRPPPYQLPVITDERGAFEFEDLPPGIYVFGVNLTAPPYGKAPDVPPVFLPGVTSTADATVVELKPGDRRPVGTIRLDDR